MAGRCRICGDKTVALGLCANCYAYRRRHGRDRPFDLVVRLTERDIEGEILRRQRRERDWDPDV